MVAVLVVAGGKGLRMGGAVRKQYIRIRDRPVLTWTLGAVLESRIADAVIAVVPGEDLTFCRDTVLRPFQMDARVRLVAGGAERQASVYEGLKACPDATRIVMVHDGVRPFVTRPMLEVCRDAADRYGGAVAAIPAVETLKRVDVENRIVATVDREPVRLAQTPQAFRFPLLMRAHEQALTDGYIGTDDAGLVERIGGDIRVVDGSPQNIKITRPFDLVLAEAFLAHLRQGPDPATDSVLSVDSE